MRGCGDIRVYLAQLSRGAILEHPTNRWRRRSAAQFSIVWPRGRRCERSGSSGRLVDPGHRRSDEADDCSRSDKDGQLPHGWCSPGLHFRLPSTRSVYAGAGSTAGEAAEISGQASAGTIDTQIVLAVSPVGTDWQSMNEIEIIGTAEFGRVHIPLPGVGTVDDLVVDINARLAVLPA